MTGWRRWGFFSDADAGKFHPSTPELRLKDQDADGIKAEVIYGILGVSTGFSDAEGGLSSPEALTCVYDIYNEWAADFCKAAPDRLAALACISSHSPSIAAAQLKRAADLGLKGAEMNVSSAFVSDLPGRMERVVGDGGRMQHANLLPHCRA